MNLTCDNCGTRFFVDSVENSFMQIGRDEYDVTYFSCPACRKVYVVGVYDLKYYDLKAAIDKEKTRVKKLVDSGQSEKAEAVIRSIQVKIGRLTRHQDKIMDHIHGTFTLQASENNQQELVYLP